MMRHSTFALSLAASLLLSACTVGPDYAGPPVVSASGDGAAGYVRADDATNTAAPTVAQWWTVLGDPVLNELEQRALAANPNIAAAQARVAAARGALRIQRANKAPNISGTGVAANLRIPNISKENAQVPPGEVPAEQSEFTTASIYNLGLNANWEIDLFGGQRRNTEAARAELGSAEASVADAQVSLTSAVAQSYIEYRDRQERIAIAQATVAEREALAALQRQRFDRGAGNLTQVEQANAQLEQARTQLSGLNAEATAYANALAILVGERPGAVDALLAQPAAVPLPPANVAIGDPASLLERRPDLRAAERRLAAQTARIGVAEAARLPRLSFLGILGIGGTKPSDLTDLDDFTAIGAPMLQWSVLDFGRGAANVEQAKSRRDEAEANYQSAALGALREVEDALTRFRAARSSVASLARAEASAAKIEQLARQRYELGAAPRQHMIEAQLQHAQAEDALIHAKSALTIEFVGLQKALGLGWAEGGAQ